MREDRLSTLNPSQGFQARPVGRNETPDCRYDYQECSCYGKRIVHSRLHCSRNRRAVRLTPRKPRVTSRLIRIM